MLTLTRDAEIWTLDLGDTENRFDLELLAAIREALDEVAGTPGPAALVVAARGKFFSNGLDLAWVMANREEFPGLVIAFHGVLSRLLSLPVPSVAAIQGHCYAGGALLSLACDFRVMRADRGFFCLPEVDLNLPFSWGMSALVQARLGPQAAHEAMTTGRRYGGAEALERGIVDHAVGEAEVATKALAIASSLTAKAGSALETIKTRMYDPALAALARTDVA